MNVKKEKTAIVIAGILRPNDLGQGIAGKQLIIAEAAVCIGCAGLFTVFIGRAFNNIHREIRLSVLVAVCHIEVVGHGIRVVEPSQGAEGQDRDHDHNQRQR